MLLPLVFLAFRDVNVCQLLSFSIHLKAPVPFQIVSTSIYFCSFLHAFHHQAIATNKIITSELVKGTFFFVCHRASEEELSDVYLIAKFISREFNFDFY